jgi:hypothetical protein
VGDLHVENFGTWRDREGRLIWGINDFDETTWLPFTNDLVRLATSALLAIEEESLKLSPEAACESILEGYSASLIAGGRPFVLAEQHVWLRQLALGSLRDPERFWKKMDAQKTVDELNDLKGPTPLSAREALVTMLPDAHLEARVVQRRAGLGSLGRGRYVALAQWAGGRIAREAKALVPPAAAFAKGRECSPEILYQTILTSSVRCVDPLVHLRGQWIVRRLAPDCSRIALSDLDAKRDEARLMRAMGYETANVHLGTRHAIDAVRHDLAERKAQWLLQAAQDMKDDTLEDWNKWRGD